MQKSLGTVFESAEDSHTLREQPNVDVHATPVATDARRYQTKSVLGRGGMGEVRLCRDMRIGRDVAVKIALQTSGRARFLREARVQGQLWYFVGVSIGTMLTPTYFLARTRATLADAEEKLQLQRWQLEQLVPTSSAPPSGGALAVG